MNCFIESIKQIANERKTTARNINKLFKSYRQKALINTERELSKSGAELIKSAVPFSSVVSNNAVPQTIRLHDLQFKIDILKKPRQWDNYRQSIKGR
ncbi:unnamed protein product, partial [marine sediment metagenome]